MTTNADGSPNRDLDGSMKAGGIEGADRGDGVHSTSSWRHLPFERRNCSKLTTRPLSLLPAVPTCRPSMIIPKADRRTIYENLFKGASSSRNRSLGSLTARRS